jgi:hypothetical protein
MLAQPTFSSGQIAFEPFPDSESTSCHSTWQGLHPTALTLSRPPPPPCHFRKASQGTHHHRPKAYSRAYTVGSWTSFIITLVLVIRQLVLLPHPSSCSSTLGALQCFQVGRQHVGGGSGGAGRGDVRLQRATVDGPGAVRPRLRGEDPGAAPPGGRRGLPAPRRQAVPGQTAVAGALARPLRGQLGPLRGQEGPLRPHERARAGPGNFPVDGLLIEPDVTAAVVGFGPPTYGGSS